MKLPRLPLLLALGLAALSPFARAADAGSQRLFNGKDLTGWDGNMEFWSVRDGAITGQTTAEKTIKANTFLVWKGGEPANFELRLSFRLTAQNPDNRANSGVQYRSKVLDAATFVVGGYQADLDSPFRFTGMLYEEKGRGILMVAGEKIRIGATTKVPDPKKQDAMKNQTAVEKLPGATPTADIAAAYKLGEWNDMVITANGSQIRHTVNGVVTADVTETDSILGAAAGVIALQLHTGPPMTIQFKNIQLKKLP